MAPVFDLNLSMLPYVTEDEFADIGHKLTGYGPKIGTDFTYTAQSILTSSIRKDLVGLRGFQFTFRGNEKFPPERVLALEKLINIHIDKMLGNEKVYTIDVFPDLYREKEEHLKRAANTIAENKCILDADVLPERTGGFQILFSIDSTHEEDLQCVFSEKGELNGILKDGKFFDSISAKKIIHTDDLIKIKGIEKSFRKALSRNKEGVMVNKARQNLLQDH